MAAIDLTHLVHETYHTRATDAWWYNGFCMQFIGPHFHLSSITHSSRCINRRDSTPHVLFRSINDSSIRHR